MTENFPVPDNFIGPGQLLAVGLKKINILIINNRIRIRMADPDLTFLILYG
jgi:hypothetical protein